MSETVKIIVTLSKGQYENLKDIQFGGIGSRMIFNAVKNGIPLDEVMDKILGYDVKNKILDYNVGQHVEKSFIDQMIKAVEDFNRKQAEYEHQQIIKLCEENDFVVPSVEIREKLEKVLPEGTRIIVSKFVDCVLMIKKCVLDPCYISENLWIKPGETKDDV